MRIGVVGKGGVGKTTVTALLSQAYARQGRSVVAVDTDSNPNLAVNLGLDEEVAATAPVIPRHFVAGPGPDETPDYLMSHYGVPTPSGVTLFHAMRIRRSADGCTCGQHAMIRSLLATTLDQMADVVVLDVEAGLEHLARAGGTLAHADVMLVVTEPTRKAVLTAARTKALAAELGVSRCLVVANKAAAPRDQAFYDSLASSYGLSLAGVIPRSPEVIDAERQGGTVVVGDELAGAIHSVVDAIESAEQQVDALEASRRRILRRIEELTDRS